MQFAYSGAALCFVAKQVTWTDSASQFSNNIAHEGGAVFVINPISITLTGTKFS